MRLDSIKLENYRCYRDLQVSFQPGFNVIAGVNGSGKTSLLKGIREALAVFTQFLSLRSGNLSALSGSDIARIQPEVFDGRYRFEPRYPVTICATGEVLGQACKWEVTRVNEATSATWSAQDVWQAAQKVFGPAEGQRVSEMTLPAVAFYPAYRQWPPAHPNEMSAATERPSRTDGYRFWWDAASDSGAFQQWAIAKSLERLQFVSERNTSWDSIRDDELGFVNVALAAAVEGARGLRYDFSQKSLLIEWGNGNPPISFQNLSDGQRVAIALVADIVRRMCLLNPHLGGEVTRETPGVVLIDELDVHLHPKWQRLMIDGLTAAFPRVQFIAASHSPQVLGELRPEQIILLRPDGTAHPQISYGLDSSRVLEQIMEAGPRSAKVDADLSALYELIERGDLTNARRLLSNLNASAPGIPELAGAEALLKRKEVIGR